MLHSCCGGGGACCRFRNGYCKSNPRKMVTMWAEKEMRNLMRLKSSGILTATPRQLRQHVLVMDFIGEGGVAAPRLKDAGLPLQRLREAYTEIVVTVRNLYQKCRLVHADLSEYNILYHRGELYIIDVSQVGWWWCMTALLMMRSWNCDKKILA